jgi:sortase A
MAVPMIGSAPEAVSEDAGQPEQAAPREEGPQESAHKGSKQRDREVQPAIPAPASNDLWMTIPKLGLYDNYVANSDAHSALDSGAAKRVSSEFPWENDSNTYISAHRLGWPGTASDHQFYNLPLLGYGDKIYLYDANGTTYTYEVTEIFEVLPSETWVTNAEAGRDMVSLQTCIENYGDYWTMGPNWYVRYVVRADRVSVTPA